MSHREFPIIFTAESVRAILAGRKSQTRRVMNPQPHPKTTLIEWNDADQAWIPWDLEPGTGRRRTGDPIRSRFLHGDVLWAKEAWRTEELGDMDEVEEDSEMQPGTDGIRFRADGAFRPIENSQAASDAWIAVHRRASSWRSPLYMPRWASRISLEVTEVRAQRLQDISEEDALAEGVEKSSAGSSWIYRWPGSRAYSSPILAYGDGWDRINRRRSPWARNDFVFAYTLRRI